MAVDFQASQIDLEKALQILRQAQMAWPRRFRADCEADVAHVAQTPGLS